MERIISWEDNAGEIVQTKILCGAGGICFVEKDLQFYMLVQIYVEYAISFSVANNLVSYL